MRGAKSRGGTRVIPVSTSLAVKVLRPKQVEEFTDNIKVKETSHSVAGFLKYMSGPEVR